MERLAREQVRLQRQAEAARQRQIREGIQAQRERLRLRAQLDKYQRQKYLEERENEAGQMTAEVQTQMASFSTLLEASLNTSLAISFEQMKISEALPPFLPPPELANATTEPIKDDFTVRVKPIGFFEQLFFRRSRYEREMKQAETAFTDAHNEFLNLEGERRKHLQDLQAIHDAANQAQVTEIRLRNADVDRFADAYRAGDPSAVNAYCSMVLERSQYPEGFPQQFRNAYSAESKEMVVDYQLPTAEVVPHVAEHRYVKTKDLIEEKTRKPSDVKTTYQTIVAALALRTIHELFEADGSGHLSVIVFSGFVDTVDPATGQNIKAYLISVRTTKERFAEIDLRRIEMKACLRNLGAQVSPQPTELQPVKPLVEFAMVDRRFVEGSDILADLESRPNLMDLTPFAFEQLVGNLFAKMGLDAKQTQASRDGGVDVVAFDTRPVIGGKVVIQAKRYRHTVGVAAVRDLFGTMNHEGANKGILVTTSSYGPDAYDFIKNKPIELIDGGGLLYYLEQHAGLRARIVFPVEES